MIVSTLDAPLAQPLRYDDEAAVTERLLAAGMSAEASRTRAALFRQCDSALRDELPCAASPIRGPTLGLFVPGRIEVLGKHTDYAGGRSLLCAIERGTCVAARKRSDSAINIFDAADGRSLNFDFSADIDIPAQG